MKIPVLIAAYNESPNLARTLSALDAHTTEPLVIDDGSEDGTARIAEQFGVVCLRREHEGKLPALQAGIRSLGRQATEPFLTLDADTRPFRPRRWAASMLAGRATCAPHLPAVVVGPLIYFGQNNPIVAARSTLRTSMHHRQMPRDPNRAGWYGANMLLDLYDALAVEEVLALPNFWPREDVALKDVAVHHGGQTYKTPEWQAASITSARRLNGLKKRFSMTAQQAKAALVETYIRQSPPGAIPYVSYEVSIAPHSEVLD